MSGASANGGLLTPNKGLWYRKTCERCVKLKRPCTSSRPCARCIKVGAACVYGRTTRCPGSRQSPKAIKSTVTVTVRLRRAHFSAGAAVGLTGAENRYLTCFMACLGTGFTSLPPGSVAGAYARIAERSGGGSGGGGGLATMPAPPSNEVELENLLTEGEACAVLALGAVLSGACSDVGEHARLMLMSNLSLQAVLRDDRFQDSPKILGRSRLGNAHALLLEGLYYILMGRLALGTECLRDAMQAFHVAQACGTCGGRRYSNLLGCLETFPTLLELLSAKRPPLPAPAVLLSAKGEMRRSAEIANRIPGDIGGNLEGTGRNSDVQGCGGDASGGEALPAEATLRAIRKTMIAIMRRFAAAMAACPDAEGGCGDSEDGGGGEIQQSHAYLFGCSSGELNQASLLMDWCLDRARQLADEGGVLILCQVMALHNSCRVCFPWSPERARRLAAAWKAMMRSARVSPGVLGLFPILPVTAPLVAQYSAGCVSSQEYSEFRELWGVAYANSGGALEPSVDRGFEVVPERYYGRFGPVYVGLLRPYHAWGRAALKQPAGPHSGWRPREQVDGPQLQWRERLQEHEQR